MRVQLLFENKPSPCPVDLTAYWSAFTDDPDSVSIPALVDEWGDELKEALVHMLQRGGRADTGGESVVERLTVEEGISAWWLTLLVERSPWKSPALFDAFRLAAVVRLCKEKGVDHLVLADPPSPALAVLRMWSEKEGVELTVFRPRIRADVKSFTDLLRSLPNLAQGALFLVYYAITRRGFFLAPSPRPTIRENGLAVVGYLGHVDLDSLARGEYRSRFFNELCGVLDERGDDVLWCHVFSRTEQFGSIEAARKRLDQLPATARRSVILLDDFLSPSVLLRAVLRYVRVAARFRTVAKAVRFELSGYAVDLEPVFRDELACSLVGRAAMDSAITVSLFEKMTGALPRGIAGLYLMESQAWERALIMLWRRRGLGLLCGCQHTAIASLDLRFTGGAEVSAADLASPPAPDMIAANGPIAVRRLLAGGFPRSLIRETEALRYGCLGSMGRASPIGKHLLVVTDYQESVTRSQLRTIREALYQAPQLDGLPILIKPHPLLGVEQLVADELPMYEVEIVTDPLSDLWQRARIVCVSGNSAAAIEAVLSGRPTLLIAHSTGLNLSPLRGHPLAQFAATATSLAHSLRSPPSGAIAVATDFFFLDPGLPRWRALLRELLPSISAGRDHQPKNGPV